MVYKLRQDWGARGSLYVNDLAMGLAKTDAQRLADEAAADLSTALRLPMATWKRGKDQIRAIAPPAAGSLVFTLGNSAGTYSASGNGLQRGRLARLSIIDNLTVGTLGAAISTTTTTSVTMTAGHTVAQWDVITIDSETMYVTAVSGNTLTVQRNANATTPATHSSGATVTRVNERPCGTGVIDSPQIQVDQGEQQVTVSCLGTLSRLVGYQPISTALYAGITIDQALRYVFSIAGWPDGDLIFDTSAITLSYWWLAQADPWSAIQQLMATEGPGSELYEDSRGRAVFKARGSKFTAAASTTSQATFQGSSGLTPFFTRPFGYDDGQKDIVNLAEVTIQGYATSSGIVVWTYGLTLTLGANEVKVLTAVATNPFSNAIAPAGGSDYIVTGGSVASVTLNRTSGAVVDITITAGAGGATLTGLQMRADSLVPTTSTIIRSTMDTSDSQAKNGTRKFTPSIWPVIAADTAQLLADWIVFWYQRGRPIVRLRTASNEDGVERTQQITREIGDRITVTETNGPLTGSYWIESIAGEAGTTHVVTYGCEKALNGLGIDYQEGTITQDATFPGGTLAWVNPTFAAAADGGFASCNNASGADAVSDILVMLLPAATRIPTGAKVLGTRVRLKGYDPTAIANTGAVIAGTGAQGALAGWIRFPAGGPGPYTTSGSPVTVTGSEITTTMQVAAWGTPANITAVDANYATYPNGVSYSTILQATNFGGALVPTNATILGVYPEVRARGNAAGTHAGGYHPSYPFIETAFFFMLINAGAMIGSGHGGTTDSQTITPSTNPNYPGYSYCSAMDAVNFNWIRGTYTTTDLWSAVLTPAIINSGTFGFGIGTYGSNVDVDAMRLTIYYKIGSTIYAVRLISRSIAGGVNKAGGALLPISNDYMYFGSPTEQWDGELTPETVNLATMGFGVQITVPNGNTCYIDELGLQVFYDEGLPTTTTHRNVVLDNAPLNYWRLDDSATTTIADVQRVTNGTISGDYVQGVEGPLPDNSNGTRFDGATAGITFGDINDFVNQSTFTLEALVFLDVGFTAANNNILNKTDGVDGWNFVVSPTGDVQCSRRGGGSDSASGPVLLKAGRWYHVVAVYSGAAITVYVNGVAGTAVTSTRNMTNTALALRCGTNSTGSANFFKGILKDVAIYAGAAGASQVLAWYQATHIATAVLDTYEAAVTADAPAGWWKLGEAANSASATDSGTGAHNGTYTGGPILGRPGLLGGEELAAQFDGASQYVSIGDFNDFAGTPTGTWEIWGKLDSLAGTPVLMSKMITDGSGLQGWHMYVSTAGTLTFCRARDGSRVDATGPAGAITAGQPFHAVATYDGANLVVYVNGVAGASTPSAQSLANTAAAMEIGRYTGGGNYVPGLLQEASVYNGTMTPARVLIHYNASAGA